MEKPEMTYCAGPLFNDSERKEMEEIGNNLERAGFRQVSISLINIEGDKENFC